MCEALKVTVAIKNNEDLTKAYKCATAINMEQIYDNNSFFSHLAGDAKQVWGAFIG